jgi:hypothetical protein
VRIRFLAERPSPLEEGNERGMRIIGSCKKIETAENAPVRFCMAVRSFGVRGGDEQVLINYIHFLCPTMISASQTAADNRTSSLF